MEQPDDRSAPHAPSMTVRRSRRWCRGRGGRRRQLRGRHRAARRERQRRARGPELVAGGLVPGRSGVLARRRAAGGTAGSTAPRRVAARCGCELADRRPGRAVPRVRAVDSRPASLAGSGRGRHLGPAPRRRRARRAGPGRAGCRALAVGPPRRRDLARGRRRHGHGRRRQRRRLGARRCRRLVGCGPRRPRVDRRAGQPLAPTRRRERSPARLALRRRSGRVAGGRPRWPRPHRLVPCGSRRRVGRPADRHGAAPRGRERSSTSSGARRRTWSSSPTGAWSGPCWPPGSS